MWDFSTPAASQLVPALCPTVHLTPVLMVFGVSMNHKGFGVQSHKTAPSFRCQLSVSETICTSNQLCINLGIPRLPLQIRSFKFRKGFYLQFCYITKATTQ